MYFTYNNKFILKMLSETEYNLLAQKIFSQYFEHMVSVLGSNTITKIVGVFQAKQKGKAMEYFMIMKNCIENYDLVTHLFDIKGSQKNRRSVKRSINVPFGDLDRDIVYKDVDFNFYIGKIHVHKS